MATRPPRYQGSTALLEQEELDGGCQLQWRRRAAHTRLLCSFRLAGRYSLGVASRSSTSTFRTLASRTSAAALPGFLPLSISER